MMQSTDEKNKIRTALNEKDGFDVWWRLLRPHTLTASFVPVFVGTMIAYVDGTFHLILFLAMLLASMLIQTATNMFNEYYDYVRGLDTEESVGISGTIVRDGIKPDLVRNGAFLLYAISILLGIYICMESSWYVAILGLLGMLVGYAYTGGPLPISYTPLGELFSGIFMGTLIIGISYFIQTETITWNVILISLPITIFIGSLNMANNIRDREGDKRGGRKTIPVLLGRDKSITLMAALFVTAYVLTILYIILNILPLWSFITLLSAGKARSVIKNFRGKTEPLEMMPAMKATGITNTLYGFLLGISLLISAV